MKINRILITDITVPLLLAAVLIAFRGALNTKGGITLAALALPWLLSLAGVLSAFHKNKEDVDAVVAAASFGVSYFIVALLVSLAFGLIFRVSDGIYLTVHILLAAAAGILFIGLLKGKNPIMARHAALVDSDTDLITLLDSVKEKVLNGGAAIPPEIDQTILEIEVLLKDRVSELSVGQAEAAKKLLLLMSESAEKLSLSSSSFSDACTRLLSVLNGSDGHAF